MILIPNYNRTQELRNLLDTLKDSKEKIFVFSDGGNCNKEICKKEEYHYYDKNIGLPHHYMRMMTHKIELDDYVMILSDDIIDGKYCKAFVEDFKASKQKILFARMSPLDLLENNMHRVKDLGDYWGFDKAYTVPSIMTKDIFVDYVNFLNYNLPNKKCDPPIAGRMMILFLRTKLNRPRYFYWSKKIQFKTYD